MSNNNDNKQPLDLTKSLPISDNAQAPSTSTQTVKKLDYVGINLVEMSSVKPPEKNDSLGISGIIQPDVTTGNLSHSDEASTSTPINETPYDVDESDIRDLLDCAERGEHRANQRPPSICKVSRILRDLSESSFTPQLVSIGPIHREDPKLQEFEGLKECYLNDLLHRCRDSTPKETLEACLKKVKTLIPQIRKCYADVKENYSDVELARMMVMDGCFILEFCFKHEDEDLCLPNKMQNLHIAMDLMLLENQVPFFVLQALFDCSVGKEVSFTLSDVLDAYLAPYIKLFYSPLPEKTTTTDVRYSTHAHVLSYLHRRYQFEVAKSSNGEEQKEKTTFHSIVELDRSGVNFKPHQEDIWSMTIQFRLSLLSCFRWFLVCCCCCYYCCCCCLFPCFSWFWIKPTLLMPNLLIDDFTELILRNFIAYEQSFPQDRYYFTSYAHAMDMLIDTREDIAKLVESKVLVNALGSNQEAADMINKVCKNISTTDFYYTEEFKRMDDYYSSCCLDHIAHLRRVYFSNPWSIIALVAAIIIFSLTVVQTIFAIKAK